MSFQYNQQLSFQAIYRFNIATSFPSNKEEASYEEISQTTGLKVSELRRILRHAMTSRVFREPREGVVAHTGASKLLAINQLVHQAVGFMTEELWPAAVRVSLLL